MADKSLADHGSLAITGRGDGNRWYGRISIPEAIARDAGFQEGIRISARCIDGKIVIQPDEKGPIKFPPKTGKGNPRYAFEAATATLGLRDMVQPQTSAKITIEDGKLLMAVPEDCLAAVQKVRKKTKKEARSKQDAAPARPVYVPQSGAYGSAAAILADAYRQSKQVRPMKILEIIQLLIDHGMKISPLGMNLFKVEGKGNMTRADLSDLANQVTKSNESNKIVLIAD